MYATPVHVANVALAALAHAPAACVGIAGGGDGDGYDLVNGRIIFEDRAECVLDDPPDVARRIGPLDRVGQRKRVHHVTKGTRFDDQYSLGSEVHVREWRNGVSPLMGNNDLDSLMQCQDASSGGDTGGISGLGSISRKTAHHVAMTAGPAPHDETRHHHRLPRVCEAPRCYQGP